MAICITEHFPQNQLKFLKLKTHPEQHDNIHPPRTYEGRNQLFSMFPFLKLPIENRCK